MQFQECIQENVILSNLSHLEIRQAIQLGKKNQEAMKKVSYQLLFKLTLQFGLLENSDSQEVHDLANVHPIEPIIGVDDQQINIEEEEEEKKTGEH